MNGKTYIKSSKTTERRFAEQMEANWKKGLLTEQVLGIKKRLPVVEAINLYLDAKQGLATMRNLKRYCKQIENHFRAKRHWDEIQSFDIERFRIDLRDKGYSDQTIKHVLGAIRGTYRHAKRLGYQVREIEFPSIKTTPGKLRYLSVEEEHRLLQSLDPTRPVKGLPFYPNRTAVMRKDMHDLFDFFVMLLDTGARFNEIATLQWSHVDVMKGTINLWRSKVRNQSILYMTERVKTILSGRVQNNDSGFVFENRKGGPKGYTSTTLRRAFRRAGLPDCTPHTLRHTHATRLIQNGMTIYEVKEILGHSDIRTTMRYSHLEQETVFRKAQMVIERLNASK